MIDLNGWFSLEIADTSQLPDDALPVLRCSSPSEVQSVKGSGWAAQFAQHPMGRDSFCARSGFGLFVVGEVMLRWDAILPESLASLHPGAFLGASDLFALIQASPEDFIHRIKGNFVLVWVDEEKRWICLYNSRYGVSPFYYASDGIKFYFSTSLAALSKCLPGGVNIDPAALAELAFFNYPLNERSYLKPIKMLRPAEVVRVTAGGLQRRWWWDVRRLYDSPLYSREEALELGSELFHRTANGLAADVGRLRVSFTSGFDSRAILSVLEKEPADLLAYSFGIPGSLNVSIPKQICAQRGIRFEPIYLDGEYEEVFDEYALRAVWLSDCLSTVERANYPYAFEKLADFSPVVITGLFGSELMRTFQNAGIMVSASLARLNLAKDIRAETRQVLREPEGAGYYAPAFLRHGLEEAEADVMAALVERFGDMPPDQRFYMFLLTEGLRKYFGAEIQMERPWGINRFPFLDDEFVEFAFCSPFAGVHAHTLHPSVENRFQSQYFYAYIIRKYCPVLLNALTDHGYAPRDVISPLALLRIGPQFLFQRWQRQRVGYREFKTEEWTEKLYRQHLFQTTPRADIFSGKLVEDFQNSSWKGARLEFAKAASLKLWLEMLSEGTHQAVVGGN